MVAWDPAAMEHGLGVAVWVCSLGRSPRRARLGHPLPSHPGKPFRSVGRLGPFHPKGDSSQGNQSSMAADGPETNRPPAKQRTGKQQDKRKTRGTKNTQIFLSETREPSVVRHLPTGEPTLLCSTIQELYEASLRAWPTHRGIITECDCSYSQQSTTSETKPVRPWFALEQHARKTKAADLR